jgi:HlyD family secretion protein
MPMPQNPQLISPSGKSSRWTKFFFWRAISPRRKIALIAIPVLAAIPLTYFLRPAGKAEYASTSYTVKKSDLAISVLEGGSLAATNLQEIKCAVEGQTTIISVVPDGYMITPEDVKNGKVLLELDGSKLKEQAIQQDITFQDAKAAYTQASGALEIQKNQNESDISAAKLQEGFAHMDLEKYLGTELTAAVLSKKADMGPLVAGQLPPEKIASLLRELHLGGAAWQNWENLQSNIDLAGAQFSSEVTTYQWSRKLGPAIPPDFKLIADADKIIAENLGRKWPDATITGEGYIMRSEVESGALTLKTKLSAMDQAGLLLNIFLQYDFPKQVVTLQSAYMEATRQLERVKAKAASALMMAEVNLKTRDAALKIQQDHIDRVNKQIAACTIRATLPGMVVYSSTSDPWRRGQDKIQEGSAVRERQLIMAIPDPAAMEVTVRVHEASIDKIKTGQKAKIIVDAFPDMTLWGEVKNVARMPEVPNWMSPDLKVYSTTVSLQGAPQALKPGMSAQVEIMVNKVAETLVVPIQAVFTYNGRRLCYVLERQTPQPRLVETGQFNDQFIQVASGLKEGEQVLLHQPPMPDAVLAKLIPKAEQVKPAAEAAPVTKSDEGATKSAAPATTSDAGAAPARAVKAAGAAADKPQAPAAEAKADRAASPGRRSPGGAH